MPLVLTQTDRNINNVTEYEYSDKFGELYHFKSDPFETTNLFENPQYRNVRNELTERLINQMMENIDKSPMPKRLA